MNKMPKRLIVFGLLTGLLQTLTYCLALAVVWYIWKHVDEQYEYGPMAGFAVIISVMVFALIVTMQNTITTIVNKKWLTNLLATLAACLIGWSQFYCIINSREPLLRAVLILTAALMALIIKIPIGALFQRRFI